MTRATPETDGGIDGAQRLISADVRGSVDGPSVVQGHNLADVEALFEAARTGDQAALARLLSMIERGGDHTRAVARHAYRTPPPYTVGLTGAPGAGKSTLVDQLIDFARAGWPAVDGADAQPIEAVGILAIDPTSPRTGGALLGDRARMQRHATDRAVFIRSMATRGNLGGLALAVPDAIRALGAAGKAAVLVETVGVGQMEVDVASATDTTIVIVTPGWGDALQANKAGLFEVADLFVVNKADREGARQSVRDLEQMLDLSDFSSTGGWRPPIVETVATAGRGIESLWEQVARHRCFLARSGELERRRSLQVEQELRRVLAARLEHDIEERARGSLFASVLAELTSGRIDPYEAADRLLN